MRPVNKVLIIPSWYPTDDAPLHGVFVEDQVKALSSNYDVAVLIPALQSFSASAFFFIMRMDKSIAGGVRVYYQRALYSRRFPVKFFWEIYYAQVRRAYLNLCEEWGNPDVIHAHVVLPAGWVAVRIGREFDIPVVITEHTGPFASHLQSKLMRHYANEALEGADAVVAVSPALASQIDNFRSGLDIKVIGNVVPDGLWEAPLKSSDRDATAGGRCKFIAVGSMVREKGIDTLLESVRILAQRGKVDFELLLVGGGRELAQYKALVLKTAIGGYCKFVGGLERDEVFKLLRQADVLVLPSHAETFGMVLVEAMALGKPVVATRCGGAEYVVTAETGLLVDIKDAGGMAAAMESCINGTGKFDSAGIRDSVCQRFGKDIYVRRMTELFGAVCAGH